MKTTTTKPTTSPDVTALEQRVAALEGAVRGLTMTVHRLLHDGSGARLAQHAGSMDSRHQYEAAERAFAATWAAWRPAPPAPAPIPAPEPTISREPTCAAYFASRDSTVPGRFVFKKGDLLPAGKSAVRDVAGAWGHGDVSRVAWTDLDYVETKVLPVREVERLRAAAGGA